MRLRRKGSAPSPAAEARKAIELLLDCPHALPAAENAWLAAHLRATGDDALLAHWRRHIAAPVLAGRCSFCDASVADRAPKRNLPKMFEAEERDYDV